MKAESRGQKDKAEVWVMKAESRGQKDKAEVWGMKAEGWKYPAQTPWRLLTPSLSDRRLTPVRLMALVGILMGELLTFREPKVVPVMVEYVVDDPVVNEFLESEHRLIIVERFRCHGVQS